MALNYASKGSGLPLVLIHAFPFSGAMWKMQAEYLAGRNFRVILPDLPGFGQSALSAADDSIEKMASQIANLLASLGINRAVIGGLSMGGYVALNLYRLFPELFAGLILCDTTFASDSDEKRRARFELIEEIKKNGMRAVVKNVLPSLTGVNTKTNNPALIRELEQNVLDTRAEAVINALRAMAGRIDHRLVLPEISIPTLLMFGEEDTITPPETGETMHRLIPNSRLRTIAGSGHLSNLETPEKFNRTLSDFLENL